MRTRTAAVDEALQRLLGATVAGKYRVDRLLGQGGMGAVFQATNTVINKRVALKFLAPEAARDADAAQRFQREAEAASLVESEHIVQIFDFGQTEERMPFLVMELLNGQDLRARLDERKILGLEEAAEVVRQVLRALVRAHGAGIVHRDLKPDNVFLCRRETGDVLVKLVDFGISKLSRKTTLDTLTRRGTILGTAYYMSPEQAQGLEEVDARADLYSVGAMLYEMLSGKPPHTAPTYEAILVTICTKDADDVRRYAPGVPEPVARVLSRALSRDRALRYASAAEMLSALEDALLGKLEAPADGAAGLTLPARPSHSARNLAQRRTWVAAGMALLFGFALTAFWLAKVRRSAPVGDDTSVPVATRMPAVPPGPAASITASPAPEVIPAGTVPNIAAASVAAPVRVRRNPPASAPSATAKRGSGVIRGLELNTKGP